jgi:flagellar assembly protein FliH
MSLSKYFKNSPSFKPENIVKQGDQGPAGWTPTPRVEDQPFLSQPIQPAAGGARDLTVAGTTALAPPFHENRDNTDNRGTAAAEQHVDLSHYVELEEAEKTAADAYRQGEKDGRELAEQDFGAATQALYLACQQLDTLRDTIIANSSREVLDLTLAIAERILRLSVREQDHTIVATIEEALRRSVKSDEFIIHIHPDDYETVLRKSADIIAGISGLNNIVVRKDKTIERGGARIESDNCTIDATIASQFEEIREALQGRS